MITQDRLELVGQLNQECHAGMGDIPSPPQVTRTVEATR
jgi:hypothetical protein